MGSGKTTVGSLLAEALGFRFVDADEYLEGKIGYTIGEMFMQDGEEVFRQYESLLYSHDFQRLENVVIATGGGAPCFYDNIDQMKKSGVTVYLDTNVRNIAERLEQSEIERPLVKGMSRENLVEYIETHLNERKIYYEQAQIKTQQLDLEAGSINKLVNEIKAVDSV